MIIIVEGIDRIGKTTFCEKLASMKGLNFIYLKDAWNYNDTVKSIKDYSAGKLDTSISFLTLLNDQGKHVIVDRLHLTEFVYGTLIRGFTNFEAVTRADADLAKLDARLILFEPTDIKLSNTQAGMDMRAMDKLFHVAFNDMSRIKHKFMAKYDSIDYMINVMQANLDEWRGKHEKQS